MTKSLSSLLHEDRIRDFRPQVVPGVGHCRPARWPVVSPSWMVFNPRSGRPQELEAQGANLKDRGTLYIGPVRYDEKIDAALRAECIGGAAGAYA